MRLTRRELAAAIAGARGFGAEAPVQAAPVSMTYLPGRVIVLDARGRICLIDSGRNASMRWMNNATSGLLARDIAAVRMPDGDERIFVLTFQSAAGWQGFVEQYDGNGKPLPLPRTMLPFRGLSAGIAVDVNRRRLLVGDTWSRTVYALPMEGRPSERPLAALTELNRVGAMAADPAGQRLFVCDPAKGRVFFLNLAAAAPRALALADDYELRAPSSIVYDGSSSTLYVCDDAADAIYSVNAPAGRSITAVRWTYLAGKREAYLKSRSFGGPVALTLDDQRRLWVGDRQSRLVFAIYLDGRQAGMVSRELRMLP